MRRKLNNYEPPMETTFKKGERMKPHLLEAYNRKSEHWHEWQQKALDARKGNRKFKSQALKNVFKKTQQEALIYLSAQ